MTNIQNQLKEQKAKIELYTNKADEEVLSMFAAQKESIQKIASTEWFKHIKLFWMAKEMSAIDALGTINPEDKYKIAEAQAKYKLAKEFNWYLHTRLN